jgi:predicted amidohydrolase YtcJ
MKRILVAISFICILFSCNEKQNGYADKIYFNARIWTGDSANAWTDAIAIKEMKSFTSAKITNHSKEGNTEMIDLGGKLMLPGFIDNHTHFLSGGYNLSSVDLRKAKTKQEFIYLLKEFCQQRNDDRWVLGGDWDHEAWGGELPSRSWIDSVTGNHPVFVSRYDGHMALANSKALELAGINRNTKVPAGGEMKKDVNGEYTGVPER